METSLVPDLFLQKLLSAGEHALILFFTDSHPTGENLKKHREVRLLINF